MPLFRKQPYIMRLETERRKTVTGDRTFRNFVQFDFGQANRPRGGKACSILTKEDFMAKQQ